MPCILVDCLHRFQETPRFPHRQMDSRIVTVLTTLATVSISQLKKHLAGKQYAVDVDVDVNKLSRLGNRHLTPISLRREVLYQYIPPATHMLCTAHIQVRIIFSSLKYLFRYSLKLLYNVEVLVSVQCTAVLLWCGVFALMCWLTCVYGCMYWPVCCPVWRYLCVILS